MTAIPFFSLSIDRSFPIVIMVSIISGPPYGIQIHKHMTHHVSTYMHRRSIQHAYICVCRTSAILLHAVLLWLLTNEAMHCTSCMHVASIGLQCAIT